MNDFGPTAERPAVIWKKGEHASVSFETGILRILMFETRSNAPRGLTLYTA